MDDLARFCCQNPDCTRYGQRNAGNLSVCARYGKLNPIRLLYCNACKDRLSERKGTAYFHCHLPEEKARDILEASVRRMIFRAGFFRVCDLRIESELLIPELHVPYWVGFRGNSESATPVVLDAVRRRHEGARIRQLILEWLAP